MLQEFARKHWQPIIIFIMLSGTYMYFDYPYAGWNVNSRLCLTLAIVEEGRFEIDSYHNGYFTGTGDKSEYNGHHYSDKAIGTSILGAVVYAPLYWLSNMSGLESPYNTGDKSVDRAITIKFLGFMLKVIVVAIPSALFAALLFSWITSHGIGGRWAAIITLLYALGTLSLPYSTLFYGHQLAAITAFGAFILAERLASIQNRKPGIAILLLFGLLMGFCFITEYTTLLILIPIAVYYLISIPWKQMSKKESTNYLVLPLLGSILPLAIMFWYNTACFGGPLSIAYSHLSHEEFRQGYSSGTMGFKIPTRQILNYLSFHPFRGLFWICPWLLIGFTGWYNMLKRRKYAWTFISIWAFISFFIVNSSFYGWWGGSCMGPRYMVPAMVFIILPAFFIEKTWIRTGLICFGVISVFHLLLMTWADPQVSSPKHEYFVGMRSGWDGEAVPDSAELEKGEISQYYYDGLVAARDGIPVTSAPLYTGGFKQLKNPEDIENWGTSIGIPGIYSIIPLLLLILAGTIILVYPFKGKKKKAEENFFPPRPKERV
jgi:hypothetical protein